MNKKSTLYIIQGFIGAGKTTFSKKLATKTNAIHLNPDDWVIKLNKDYLKDWNNCFDKTLVILWDKTKEYLLSGKDVIFDMGFWLKKDRDFARKIAEETNSNIIHYYLSVPDEILKERIKKRPKAWAEKHLQNFDLNKSKFELPTHEEQAIIIENY